MIASRHLRAIAISLLLAIPSAAATLAENPVVADPVRTTIWRSPASIGAPYPGRHGALTPAERTLASAAWRYIVNNTQAQTGLVNAVDNYPSTTLWDAASAIAGIVSAQRLELVTEAAAVDRLRPLLETLQHIPLFRGLCPNKAYNTMTAEPVDYANKPGEIGCSALDVGRLLIWLRIVAQRYPELSPAVGAVASHLNLGTLVTGGVLQGAAIDPAGKTVMLQEGRLGYEEYAARGFSMWGYDTDLAARAAPYGLIKLYGITIPYDARDPRVFDAHNYVVAEGAILDGIEFGWNDPADITGDPFTHKTGWGAHVADNIYRAQEARHASTGILTARTEHQLSGPPYFVYDTLFSDGQPWATITDAGQSVPAAAAVASKAAIGLWVLWNTPYTERLFAAVQSLVRPDRGIAEGRLEQSGEVIDAFTVNTNGIILESLAYKIAGKLHASAPPLPRPVSVATLPAPALPAVSAAPSDLPDSVPGPPRNAPLTNVELEAARVAWRYFENNTQPQTGLVNAVDNYPSTTLWDTAAALGGVVSAHELGIIPAADAQARLGRIVTTFGAVKLFRGVCPNKAYNTATLVPTDYGNSPAEIGCSALDIGRMLVWLRIVHNRYPALRPTVEATVAHWQIGNLVRGGEIFGTVLERGRIEYRQEGRLGYEEYAAKGFQLWGHRTATASRPEPYAVSEIEGVPIAHDRRNGANSGGHNYVVTESQALDGIEFGWTAPGRSQPDRFTVEQARNVFMVQQRRYRRTGILTARTEHQLTSAPNFVYDTIFADDVPWATVDASGNPVYGAAAVAIKAALGMWALWPNSYSDLLFEKTINARDPDRGFYEGILEGGGPIRAYTVNNNGIILETLLFKAKGPLINLPAL